MRRKFDGVTAFVGLPGSGKTYSLAAVGARAMDRDIPVYCNAGFDLVGARPFASFDEFLGIPSGSVVLWDELPLYVNARKWQEFPDGLLYRLTQVRKDSIRLYYSAIHEMMIDTNVRRITFNMWLCRSITYRFFTRSLHWPDELRRANARARGREFVWVRKSIASLYDSWGKVAAPERRRAERESQRWERLDVAEAEGPAPPAPTLGRHEVPTLRIHDQSGRAGQYPA